MIQSNNPFYLLGTYLGVLAGLFLHILNLYPFMWLPKLIEVNFGDPLILNFAGGALAGYLLHIFWRVWTSGGKKTK